MNLSTQQLKNTLHDFIRRPIFDTMNTKAFHLVRYGEAEGAFELRPLTIASPVNDQVLIEVKSFGLNFADVMARRGLYKAAPPLPAVLGYEVAGVVSEVGPAVNNVELGQKVLAFTRFGGYAQHVITPSIAVVPLNSEIGFPQATALGTQYGTALYAAYWLANLRAGETVLIHAAAGGVGTALIQLAKLRGCYVIALAGSEDKLEYVKRQGADHAINYRTFDFVEEVRKIRGELGVDAVFDPIGGRNFKRSYSLLSIGGRLVGYGASDQLNRKKGILSKLKLAWGFGFYHPVNFIVNNKALMGINMLKLADHHPEVMQRVFFEVLSLAAQGKIEPVIGQEFPSDELAQAHAFLESRQSVGKIAVTW